MNRINYFKRLGLSDYIIEQVSTLIELNDAITDSEDIIIDYYITEPRKSQEGKRIFYERACKTETAKNEALRKENCKKREKKREKGEKALAFLKEMLYNTACEKAKDREDNYELSFYECR